MKEKKDYIIVSTAVTDEVTEADGTKPGCFLGGAGIYALSGARLWTKEAVIVTGIGEDFGEAYREWFRRSRCREEGLLVKDAHTAISHVQYHEDGERTEHSEHGPEHYRHMEAEPEELEPFFAKAKGVYIFKDLPEVYWKKIIMSKRKYRFRLMWEINAEAAVPERAGDVRRLAEQCEMFSLNRTEAMRLLQTKELAAVIDRLLTWKVSLIYLRAGEKGAYVLTNGKAYRIPCEARVRVKDPTGAGNSSTAAVMYGYCEGFTPEECGIMGSISAARAIEQYGPPEITDGKMLQAKKKRELMLEQMKGGESHGKK